MREKIEQMLREAQAQLEGATSSQVTLNIGGRCEALLDVLALFEPENRQMTEQLAVAKCACCGKSKPIVAHFAELGGDLCATCIEGLLKRGTIKIVMSEQ